jgi:hypothetical protein
VNDGPSRRRALLSGKRDAGGKYPRPGTGKNQQFRLFFRNHILVISLEAMPSSERRLERVTRWIFSLPLWKHCLLDVANFGGKWWNYFAFVQRSHH